MRITYSDILRGTYYGVKVEMCPLWIRVAPATLDAIVVNAGEIVQPIGADAPEITARFRDPAGNVIGLYQQPA